MPKEHAGGADRNGRPIIAVEWHKEEAFPVEITHFNFEAIDRLDDQVREALADGRIEKFLEDYVATHLEELRRKLLNKFLDEIIECDKPKFKIVCMAIAAGHVTATRRTLDEWATIFGVTKQDVQQAVEGEREEFHLRKSRTTRDEEAREKMRAGNFRPKEQLSK